MTKYMVTAMWRHRGVQPGRLGEIVTSTGYTHQHPAQWFNQMHLKAREAEDNMKDHTRWLAILFFVEIPVDVLDDEDTEWWD